MKNTSLLVLLGNAKRTRVIGATPLISIKQPARFRAVGGSRVIGATPLIASYCHRKTERNGTKCRAFSYLRKRRSISAVSETSSLSTAKVTPIVKMVTCEERLPYRFGYFVSVMVYAL